MNFQKFFVPAVNNIRLNLGDESVSEDQVNTFLYIFDDYLSSSMGHRTNTIIIWYVLNDYWCLFIIFYKYSYESIWYFCIKTRMK